MKNWSFIDGKGSFRLPDPHLNNYLYFPLVNEAGMMSSITPTLHGDIKIGHNYFLTPPVSVEDLHNSRSGRNFWLYIEGYGAWSVAGASAQQRADILEPSNSELVTLEAGLLWHKITRENPTVGVKAETTNFVPASDDRVELMLVTVSNIGERPLVITPTAAIPIYGRSADNLRDHRHVTALLHRVHTEDYGVVVKPSMSFDERGHTLNDISYVTLGMEEGKIRPRGFFPEIEAFIGLGGTLEWPQAVVTNSNRLVPAGFRAEGYESLGGIRFANTILEPGDQQSYLLILGIFDEADQIADLISKYGSPNQFQEWLKTTQDYWQEKISGIAIRTGNARFDGWMKWIAVQPILRRLFGNSFLPFHDYGRGGRGWRDLWQDTLAQLLMDPSGVDDLLWNYFAGVRIDGSNATIIGKEPGEFKADRNDIPRVWMDHGAWPWITTKLYIDQSGDLDFLFRNQVYFKDRHIDRCQAHDKEWLESLGTQLKNQRGDSYQGTILEHLLVQHLTAFFNVGDHNNIRLEGGDWNDGMDMASMRGESVAFTALYAHNLHQISDYLKLCPYPEVEVASELLFLLDTIGDQVDYGSVISKKGRLAQYLSSCQIAISGEKRIVSILDLARDLETKATWMVEHLRKNEWIQAQEGVGWFNGYYDNDGNRVEHSAGNRTRMTLTGQVFTMMGGVPDEDQTREMLQAASQHLWDDTLGGYRLNTDFGQVLTNLGRFTGFAYGHKENGAMFSHMDMMWLNALFQRGLVQEGWNGLHKLYQHCQDFAVSRIYPGIPEYIDPRGRGVYPFLTGSASWLLLTLLTEFFGVKGRLGDLLLAPKLVPDVLDEDDKVTVFTQFAGRKISIAYFNPGRYSFGEYQILRTLLNGDEITLQRDGAQVIIPREVISALPHEIAHEIFVELGKS
jgi:cellobiose phosphorylase